MEPLTVLFLLLLVAPHPSPQMLALAGHGGCVWGSLRVSAVRVHASTELGRAAQVVRAPGQSKAGQCFPLREMEVNTQHVQASDARLGAWLPEANNTVCWKLQAPHISFSS